MELLSFGEILWDIIEEKEYLGGAPFNLAAHAAKMGIDSFMISSVGKDQRGTDALRIAGDLKVDKTFIDIHHDKPTGTVDVFLKNGQPAYTINENVAWDEIIINEGLLEKIEGTKWDVFCFGTLVQRTGSNRKLLDEIFSILNARHIFYDINLRQNYYDIDRIKNSLAHSTIVKLNEEEAEVISELSYNEVLGQKELSANIAKDYNIDIVCITRGENGAAIYSKEEFEEIPGIHVNVADTVGAGDGFSAGFLYVYLLTKDAFKSGDFACRIGAYVASRAGAIPDYSDKIIQELEKIKKV